MILTNVQHLAQLEGDARAVGEDLVRRWPTAVIVSSRRDVEHQAAAMAGNCIRQRDWILGNDHTVGTYRWSKAAQLCHDWSLSHVDANGYELAAAFAHLLNALPVSELVKLSRHLAPVTAGAHALDVRPMLTALGESQAATWRHGQPYPEMSDVGREVHAFLQAEAVARGGLFLESEGNVVVWHWQAKD
jgi:hypothetical protein